MRGCRDVYSPRAQSTDPGKGRAVRVCRFVRYPRKTDGSPSQRSALKSNAGRACARAYTQPYASARAALCPAPRVLSVAVCAVRACASTDVRLHTRKHIVIVCLFVCVRPCVCECECVCMLGVATHRGYAERAVCVCLFIQNIHRARVACTRREDIRVCVFGFVRTESSGVTILYGDELVPAHARFEHTHMLGAWL